MNYQEIGKSGNVRRFALKGGGNEVRQGEIVAAEAFLPQPGANETEGTG